jgi:hypothetical protein
MRAKFIRGQDPKKSMDIGIDAKVYKFLKEISEDYRLNPEDSNYLGFINVYADGFYDKEQKEGFIIFVQTWPKYKPLMNRLGLSLGSHEKPDIEETVFVPSYGLEE